MKRLSRRIRSRIKYNPLAIVSCPICGDRYEADTLKYDKVAKSFYCPSCGDNVENADTETEDDIFEMMFLLDD